MKYAKVSGIVRWSGGSTSLTRGKSADDNHPLVLERPDLFDDASPDADLAGPTSADETDEPPVPVIERATAAPGEKRTVPRSPRGKTGSKGGASE